MACPLVGTNGVNLYCRIDGHTCCCYNNYVNCSKYITYNDTSTGDSGVRP